MNPIDAPGTPEADWRAWPALRDLPVLDVSGWRAVVVVAAHPDDEVLGAGGLLATLGVPVRLVAVTDGEASDPRTDPARLAARRIAETDDAWRHLDPREGPREVVRLGMPDAGVRAGDLAPRLAELLRGFDACLAPWERDAHRDHEAAGRAALTAGAACDVPVLRFPIWAWHWARPGDPRLPWPHARRVPLTDEALAAKRAAIGCFRSQLGSVLPPETVAHFTRDQEVLFR